MNPQLEVPANPPTVQGVGERSSNPLRPARAMAGAGTMFPAFARVEMPSMWQRPPDALLSAQAVVDVFARPAWLMDDRRTIYRSNRTATAALQAGNWVVEKKGLLRCIDPASDQRLGMALTDLVAARFDGAGGSQPAWHWLCVDDLAGGAALPATISLLTPDARRASEMLVLFTLHDPNHDSSVDPVILDRLFGLTPAEARVANALIQGLSPKDIAAASGVALGTVRTQLKSVFAKTRSRRQAELVRLLIGLCPG